MKLCQNDVYALACAPNLAQYCDREQCSIGVDADCSIGCSSDCTPGCEADPTTSCLGLCEEDCVPDCTVRCGAYQDIVCEDSAEAERESCRAQALSNCEGACQQTCDFECDTFCGPLETTASCDEMCGAACGASCSVSPVAPCRIECRIFRAGECQQELSGQCQAGCSAQPGSVFCDGQYVYHGGDVMACIAALDAVLKQPVTFAEPPADAATDVGGGQAGVGAGQAASGGGCAFYTGRTSARAAALFLPLLALGGLRFRRRASADPRKQRAQASR